MPNKRYRVDRLAEQIQREVDDILLKRVRDPRVQDITITGVDVTGDLQQATIYYSLLSDKASDGEKAQQGLDKAKGLIRSELGIVLTFSRLQSSRLSVIHRLLMAVGSTN